MSRQRSRIRLKYDEKEFLKIILNKNITSVNEESKRQRGAAIDKSQEETQKRTHRFKKHPIINRIHKYLMILH